MVSTAEHRGGALKVDGTNAPRVNSAKSSPTATDPADVTDRLRLDTYYPEVGRYGTGAAMQAAEAVFAADSSWPSRS